MAVARHSHGPPPSGITAPMASQLPDHLKAEQAAVEADIRAAFHGVGRGHGVSWSESEAIDNYSSLPDRAKARSKDTERRWEELVDDPNWNPGPGIGGFSFLDPIGYRYYIAPAMIRVVRAGSDQWGIDFALTVNDEFWAHRIGLFKPAQGAAIARFLRFMISVDQAARDEFAASYGGVGSDIKWTCGWRRALESHWDRFEP
ncbi:MAG: DUF6714 family protein [Phycisphaerales bacterium]